MLITFFKCLCEMLKEMVMHYAVNIMLKYYYKSIRV